MRTWDEGPRIARPLTLLVAAALALGACSAGPDETDDALAPDGQGAEGVAPGVAEVTALPAASPTPRPTPMSLALDARPIDTSAFPNLEGADLRPGSWSPEGDALIVWRVVGQAQDGQPIGRLGTAAVAPDSETDPSSPGADGPTDGAPSPVWESGDVQAVLPEERAADWLRDGILVIARSDSMLVDADGTPVSAGDGVTGLIGQVREVLVAPNGRSWLAMGPDRAWLVGADRTAQEIAGTEADGARAWSWRSDSAALAVAVGEEYFTLDVETAAVDKVLEIEPVLPDRDPPAPRWLAGGRLFITAPAAPPGGRLGAAHRIVEPSQRSATDLHAALGISMNPVTPYDGSAWVSPDGRYVLYPEIIQSDGAPAHRATWIYDVPGDRAREHPPVGAPTWSPDGHRFAWVEAGELKIGDVEAAEPIAPAQGADVDDTRALVWSPDSRWLLFSDTSGAPRVVRADGLAASGPAAGYAQWAPPPSWSPLSDRFAASVGDDSGATTLTIVRFTEER